MSLFNHSQHLLLKEVYPPPMCSAWQTSMCTLQITHWLQGSQSNPEICKGYAVRIALLWVVVGWQTSSLLWVVLPTVFKINWIILSLNNCASWLSLPHFKGRVSLKLTSTILSFLTLTLTLLISHDQVQRDVREKNNVTFSTLSEFFRRNILFHAVKNLSMKLTSCFSEIRFPLCAWTDDTY